MKKKEKWGKRGKRKTERLYYCGKQRKKFKKGVLNHICAAEAGKMTDQTPIDIANFSPAFYF